jgi:hypothetical protein
MVGWEKSMIRKWMIFGLGILVGVVGLMAFQLRKVAVEPVAASGDLEQSLDQLADAVREAGVFVRQHTWFGSAEEQAEAYRHIVRALTNSLESRALAEPDFPFFQALNHFNKLGMDNSDQKYRIALFNGDGAYRVWGTRGTSRRLDFAVYGLDSMASVVDTLSTDDLEVASDGSFEVWIGGPVHEGNWLRTEPGPQRLLVRQIHSDWANELPGEVHIDRVDGGRPPYPEFSAEIMAERLTAATNFFAEEVRLWPEFSRTRMAILPANTLLAPRDTGSEGGLAGRLMSGGHYELADDEALIVTTWPSGAKYQGIQLGHHWWESLDYANRQTSLTTDQARLSSDGAYHFVIANTDPGVPNWLDTEGFSRGVILMRFDGLATPEIPEEHHPQAKVVKLADLRAQLPADEPVVTDAQRASQLAERRQHAQRRENF